MTFLGPFWCQRDRAWVRFNIDQGRARAEIFQGDSTISTWQSVDHGSWPTSYGHDLEGQEIFYSLKNGVLYSTEGKASRWEPEEFQANYYLVDGWSSYNISAEKRKTGFDPFTDYQKDARPLAPYHQLPQTPEMVEQEKERIRSAQETENFKWQSFKRRELRAPQLTAAARGTVFAENVSALALLSTKLDHVLAEYPYNKFETCADYLKFLKHLIEIYDDPLHQQINQVAYQTDVDIELGLVGDELLRRSLIEHKKTVFFNLLREEVAFICQEFNKEYNILSPEDIAEPELEQPLQIYEREQELYETIYEGSNPELTQLEQIQIAVTLAQCNYREWFEDKSGVKEIRGRDGFFSRWFFRHGDSGQKRAINFSTEIHAEQITENEATTLVNSLLRDNKTAYHRHSFASFLLDELKLIQNSPWSTIAADRESNLYNQSTVIDALESYVYHQMQW
ncbi:MAG: hypothetical protein CK430_02790 [Legionella sp.]|nr:MAG: hypothetical protein CK430_02790 [Legionella sp.]